MEKNVTLCIKNVPIDKIDHIKTFIKTLRNVTDMDLEVELAPIEIDNLIKQYDALFKEITTIKNLILEKVIQHFDEAINKLEKRLLTKKLEKKIPRTNEKRKKLSVNDIKAALQKNISKLKSRPKTAEILAILASNPNEEFTSHEISDIAYGKGHKHGQGHIIKYLKQFPALVKRRRVKNILKYKWKDTKLLKKL